MKENEKIQYKTSYWKLFDSDTNSYECQNCEGAFYLDDGTPFQNHFYFCPQCGCKMEEGDY